MLSIGQVQRIQHDPQGNLHSFQKFQILFESFWKAFSLHHGPRLNIQEPSCDICHLTLPDHFNQNKSFNQRYNYAKFLVHLPIKEFLQSIHRSLPIIQQRWQWHHHIAAMCLGHHCLQKWSSKNGSWESSKPHCRTSSQHAKAPTKCHKSPDKWKGSCATQLSNVSSANKNIT